MFRKNMILFGILSAMLAIGCASSLYWALVQSPDFYEEALAEQTDPVVQQEAAKRFVQRTLQLVDEIRHSKTWSEEFTEQQVNSWLAVELHQKFSDWVPSGVSDPRVKFDDEQIHIAFHFEQKKWDGIVSLQLKPWVTEPNRLAIQIKSIRAGLVPIPLDEVLHKIANRFETDQRRFEWRQVDGTDVVIVDLNATHDDVPILQAVEVMDGAFRLSGNRTLSSEAMDSEIARLTVQSAR